MAYTKMVAIEGDRSDFQPFPLTIPPPFHALPRFIAVGEQGSVEVHLPAIDRNRDRESWAYIATIWVRRTGQPGQRPERPAI